MFADFVGIVTAFHTAVSFCSHFFWCSFWIQYQVSMSLKTTTTKQAIRGHNNHREITEEWL